MYSYILCCQRLKYCIVVLWLRRHSCILWIITCKMLLYRVVSCISVSCLGNCFALCALNVLKYPAFCLCCLGHWFQWEQWLSWDVVNLNWMKKKSFDQIHLRYVFLSCLTMVLQVHINQRPDSFCVVSWKLSVDSWDPWTQCKSRLKQWSVSQWFHEMRGKISSFFWKWHYCLDEWMLQNEQWKQHKPWS